MTNHQAPLELMGVPGSPYTRKMLALLRYRRIAYRLLPGSRHLLQPDPGRFRSRPDPKVALLPTFYLKDQSGQERAVCDSTPLIREFESSFEGRSVIPTDPALAFIDYLLEDYADEWLTKAMFHYRWSYPADIKKAGELLPRWNNITAADADIEPRSRAISELQISRLRYVGSNDITAQTIEQSFKRFIDLLDKHLQCLPFLLGKRPAACDFAIYGQLTCMALFDPTPQQIILERAPRVYAWTEVLEDLSGYETMEHDWLELEQCPGTLLAILRELGTLYVPYLLANSKAVATGQDRLLTELDGRVWEQNAFPYQDKCLRWIRELFNELPQEASERLSKLVLDTGIEQLLR